jgi:hypothetical protein
MCSLNSESRAAMGRRRTQLTSTGNPVGSTALAIGLRRSGVQTESALSTATRPRLLGLIVRIHLVGYEDAIDSPLRRLERLLGDHGVSVWHPGPGRRLRPARGSVLSRRASTLFSRLTTRRLFLHAAGHRRTSRLEFNLGYWMYFPDGRNVRPQVFRPRL